MAPPPVLGAFLPELRSPSRLSTPSASFAAAAFAAALLLLPPWPLYQLQPSLLQPFAAAAFQRLRLLGGGLLSGRFCAAAFSAAFRQPLFSCRLLSRFLLGFFSASCCAFFAAAASAFFCASAAAFAASASACFFASAAAFAAAASACFFASAAALAAACSAAFARASAFAFASAAALAAASCASLPVRPLWLLPPRRPWQPLLQPASAAPSLLSPLPAPAAAPVRAVSAVPVPPPVSHVTLPPAAAPVFHAVQRRDVRWPAAVADGYSYLPPPRIDHDGINRRSAAAAGRGIQMLVKRTPDQQRDQNDVQRD